MLLQEHKRIDEVCERFVVKRAEDGRPRVESVGHIPYEMLSIECDCASCGAKIHPIRARGLQDVERGRKISGAAFIAVTCPTEVNMRCMRTKEAREAMASLCEFMEEAAVPV